MCYRFLLSFTLLLSISFCSLAQLDESIDSRLLAKYSEEYLNKLKADNSDHLNYLNFNIKNSFQIADVSNDSEIEYKTLTKINQETKQEVAVTTMEGIDENFNPYLYNCEPGNQTPNYYKIGDTGKMIVMESQVALKTKYKAYKEQLK